MEISSVFKKYPSFASTHHLYSRTFSHIPSFPHSIITVLPYFLILFYSIIPSLYSINCQFHGSSFFSLLFFSYLNSLEILSLTSPSVLLSILNMLLPPVSFIDADRPSRYYCSVAGSYHHRLSLFTCMSFIFIIIPSFN